MHMRRFRAETGGNTGMGIAMAIAGGGCSTMGNCGWLFSR